MAGALSNSPAAIKDAVRKTKSGAMHISQDFVPTNSKNCLSKRGSNSQNKGTIIWEDMLPDSLSSEIILFFL